jgi:hypothetical protein
VEQSRAAVAVVTWIGTEIEAGREPDSRRLDDMLEDAGPEALARLCAEIVRRVPGALDEFLDLAWHLAIFSRDP